MRNRKRLAIVSALGVMLLMGVCGISAPPAFASEKKPPPDPNDPTYRLFQLLNANYGGQLKDFYVLADIYKSPQDPQEENRHVLRVEYDQKRMFGRFRIYVRSVGRMTPEQLKDYAPKQVYEFANADDEKFEKIEPGPFGQQGDLYFRAEPGRPLHSAPTTDAVRKAYEQYMVQYILPALEKH